MGVAKKNDFDGKGNAKMKFYKSGLLRLLMNSKLEGKKMVVYWLVMK